MKKIQQIKFPFAVLGLLGLSCCMHPDYTILDQNPSNTPTPNSYRLDEAYILARDLLLWDSGASFARIVEPGGSAPFVEDFLQNPRRYSYIKAYLPKGTRITVSSFARREFHQSVILDAFANIEGFELKKPVSISSISTFHRVDNLGLVVTLDPSNLVAQSQDPSSTPDL